MARIHQAKGRAYLEHAFIERALEGLQQLRRVPEAAGLDQYAVRAVLANEAVEDRGEGRCRDAAEAAACHLLHDDTAVLE